MTRMNASGSFSVGTTMGSKTALALVALAGMEQDEKGRYDGKYWHLEEAVEIALMKIAGTTPEWMK